MCCRCFASALPDRMDPQVRETLGELAGAGAAASRRRWTSRTGVHRLSIARPAAFVKVLGRELVTATTTSAGISNSGGALADEQAR